MENYLVISIFVLPLHHQNNKQQNIMITLENFKDRKSDIASMKVIKKQLEVATIPCKKKKYSHMLDYYEAMKILKEFFCSSTEQEEFTDCNKRTAYRIPIKCIANINGSYCVIETFLTCQLLRENYVNDNLNYYYHSINVVQVPKSSIKYWNRDEMIFLAEQIMNQDKLSAWCKELKQLL